MYEELTELIESKKKKKVVYRYAPKFNLCGECGNDITSCWGNKMNIRILEKWENIKIYSLNFLPKLRQFLSCSFICVLNI